MAAPPPDEIAGTVIDSDTGKPIMHARVTAAVWTDRREQYGDVFVALTGEEGNFRFTGLPKSECEVSAEKAGYQKEVRSNHFSARPDDFSLPLTLRLTPTGVLTVRVLDQSGSAVDRAQVAIVRRGEENQPYAINLSVAYAPEDGLRRFLPRGSYRVVAISPGSGNLLRARSQTFLPTYYPGTTSISQAEWIDVVPGKEVEADVQVTLIQGHEIRGHISSAGTLMQLSVAQLSLLPAGSVDYYMNWGLVQFNRASGEFRVSGLAPGAYVLNAGVCLSPTCNPGGSEFRKSVQVVDANIDNLVISDADRVPGR
jgi:hypothetical protein